MSDDNIVMFPAKDGLPVEASEADVVMAPEAPVDAPPVEMPTQDVNVIAQKQLIALLWAQCDNSSRLFNRSVLQPGQQINPMPHILNLLILIARATAVSIDERLVMLGEERTLKVNIPGGNEGMPS